MADPATEPDASTGRRHRRDERRRRRIRRVVAVVASVAVFALFVVLATDAVRFGGDDRPSLAGTAQPVEPDDTQPSASTASTALAARQCRTLSTTDPLRLWIGGDSLAGSLGPALGTIAGATGVVQPYFDSRVSSGLSSPGFFDWPEHATERDGAPRPRGRRVHHRHQRLDDPRRRATRGRRSTRQEVDSMMKTLIGSGRTVYWVGAPTLKDKEHGRRRGRGERGRAGRRQAPRRGALRRRLQAVLRRRTASSPAISPTRPARSSPCAPATVSTSPWTAATTWPASVYELVDAQCGVTEQTGRGRHQADHRERGQHPGRARLGVVVGLAARTTTPAAAAPIATTPPAPAPTTLAAGHVTAGRRRRHRHRRRPRRRPPRRRPPTTSPRRPE